MNDTTGINKNVLTLDELLYEYSLLNINAGKLSKRASILMRRQFDRDFNDFIIKMESAFRRLCKYRIGRIFCKIIFGGG